MISIIPAIDIIDGKCVRLSQGDYTLKKIYNENPLDIAKMFEDNGIKNLHLVDLDGAKAKHVVNLKTLEKIAKNTNLMIDFGGGIKTDTDIKNVFNSGANQTTIGTVAITEKELFKKWLKTYGSDKIILGADVKDRQIAVSGWLEVSKINLNDFIADYKNEGVQYILCTDISKDGMLQGTAMELYKELQKEFSSLKIIASGGITTIDEIYELDKSGVYGVIVGKAIYEGRITMQQIKSFIS